MIVFHLIITIYSEHYFNKLFTFVQLDTGIIQLRVGKYGIHESHSTVPLPLKKRGTPHAGV